VIEELHCVETKIVVYFIVEKKIVASRFERMDVNTRLYRRYNAVGRQITLHLIPSSDKTKREAYFQASVEDLIGHAFHEVDDSAMVGLTIQNQVKEN